MSAVFNTVNSSNNNNDNDSNMSGIVISALHL